MALDELREEVAAYRSRRYFLYSLPCCRIVFTLPFEMLEIALILNILLCQPAICEIDCGRVESSLTLDDWPRCQSCPVSADEKSCHW